MNNQNDSAVTTTPTREQELTDALTGLPNRRALMEGHDFSSHRGSNLFVVVRDR